MPAYKFYCNGCDEYYTENVPMEKRRLEIACGCGAFFKRVFDTCAFKLIGDGFYSNTINSLPGYK